MNLIFPIFNYTGSEKRYQNITKTIENVSKYNVQIYVVELCYSDQEFKVTEKDNPNHLQLRTNFILWHKENIINLCVKILPENWDYFAWIDSDVFFENDDWLLKTQDKLEKNDVLQLFSHVESFENIHNGIVYQNKNLGHTKDASSGYAWAISKKAFQEIGGLFDKAIIGGGDKYLSYVFLHQINHESILAHAEGLKKSFLYYYEKCPKLQCDYVDNNIKHFDHGQKGNRFYSPRHEILNAHNFDPNIHLKYDKNGILTPSVYFPDKLFNDIKLYFKCRKD